MNKEQFNKFEASCDWNWPGICRKLELDWRKYRTAWLSTDRGDAFEFYKKHMEQDTTKLGRLLAGIDGQED